MGRFVRPDGIENGGTDIIRQVPDGVQENVFRLSFNIKIGYIRT